MLMSTISLLIFISLKREYSWRIAFGIIFSSLGDFFLLSKLFDNYFIVGMGCFFIAMICYLTIFIHTELKTNFSYNRITYCASILSLSLLLIITILSRESNHILQIGITIYFTLVTIVSMFAITHNNKFLIIGLLLFYISDILIGINDWIIKIPFYTYLNLLFYYSGQIFIVKSTSSELTNK